MGGVCDKQKFDNRQNIDPRTPSQNKCSMPQKYADGSPTTYLDTWNDNVCSEPYGNDSAKYCLYIGKYNGDGTKLTDYEWLPEEKSETRCHYWNGGAEGHLATQDSPGCCNGDCVIVGGKNFKCARVSFNAFKPLCCFKDMACNGSEDNCFDSPLRERTCDPDYRDISSLQCQDTIENYCSGDKNFPGIQDWKDLWKKNKKINVMNLLLEENQQENEDIPPIIKTYSKENVSAVPKSKTNSGINSFSNFLEETRAWGVGAWHSDVSWVGARTPRDKTTKEEKAILYPEIRTQPCLNAVFRAGSSVKICSIDQLKDAKIVPGILNPEGYEWSKNLINKIFERYFSEIGGYQNFLSIDSAGFGRDADFEEELYDFCKNIPSLCIAPVTKICSVVTSEQVANQSTGTNYKKWCGCYMPEKQYEATDLGGLVPRECSEFCNNDQSIPHLDKNLTKLECLENTCSISDVTVNLNKTTGSDLTFSQVCPGCGNSTVQYGYTTTNYALDKIQKSLIGTVLNSSTTTIPDGNYFITFLTHLDTTVPTESEYLNNPYAEINLTSNTIKSFTLVSRGTESFTSSNIPSGGENKTLYFNSIFQKNLIPTKKNIVTILSNSNTVIFSTIKYSKREIKPPTKNSEVTTPGHCNWKVYSGIGSACLWRAPNTVTKKSSGSDTTNYHSRTDARSSINRCTCRIINQPLDVINSTFKKIDLTTNCGKIECYDKNGNEVNCGSDSEKKLESVTEVLQEEYQEQIDKKYKKISYLLIGIIIFFTIYIIVDIFVKKIFK